MTSRRAAFPGEAIALNRATSFIVFVTLKEEMHAEDPLIEVPQEEHTMEPFQMLQVSTYLFGIAALGGVAMGLIRFTSGGNPPSWLAMLHGFLAGAGLTLLAYAAATMDVPAYAFLALLLFAIAAAGGIILNLHYHLRDIPLPKWLVIVHAVAAVVAFILLWIAAFPRD